MAGIGVVKALIKQTLEQLGITSGGVFNPGGHEFGDVAQADIVQLQTTGTELFAVSAGVLGVGASDDGATVDGVIDLSGGGTSTALKLPLGSQATPAITMGGGTTSGLFAVSATDWALARAGGLIWNADGSGLNIRTDLILKDAGSDLLIAAGFIQGNEMTAPAAGAANSYRLFAEDDGGGKTRLMAIFATGAAQQIAIEP